LAVGNAFCLIPLLHLVFYNPWADSVIGTGWSQMAASFGWVPLFLSLTGLVLLNGWWWKRSDGLREEMPGMLAIAGVIGLLLALSPFCTELFANLSLRDLYLLPTAREITLTGDARTTFLNWKFVAVLLDSMVSIFTWLPLVLMAVASGGALVLQLWMRALKISGSPERKIFPTSYDWPWIMALIGSGLFWSISRWVEPAEAEQIRDAAKRVSAAVHAFCGLEFIVLFSAALFFICGHELTKRLGQSKHVHPFYGSMLILVEAGVFICVELWPVLTPSHTPTDRHDISAALLIRKKIRAGNSELSLWKFEGKDLVQSGLLLGLILSCSGMVFMMTALAMARISVIYISALIDWGNSITKPLTDHFDPRNYGMHDQLAFWALCSLGYVSLGLALGLGVVMVLSALEFIRFNSYRFYKISKARSAISTVLAE
jgi:hypothetical protein